MASPNPTTTDQPRKVPRAFFEAARFGSMSALKQHLNGGIDVNAIDPRTKGTALHHVAAGGHEKALDALLATGKVDLLARDRFGRLAFEICEDKRLSDRLLGLHVEQAKRAGMTELPFRSRTL